MTSTLPTSPTTHTIEYKAVMMIATMTEVELLSSSGVLSHLELFRFVTLELLLKFRQNALLFDTAGLVNGYRKSEMLPPVSIVSAVLFTRVPFICHVLQCRYLSEFIRLGAGVRSLVARVSAAARLHTRHDKSKCLSLCDKSMTGGLTLPSLYRIKRCS